MAATYALLARELPRASSGLAYARAEPLFSARHGNEPARAELKTAELKCGSHRAQPELARVHPELRHAAEIRRHRHRR